MEKIAKIEELLDNYDEKELDLLRQNLWSNLEFRLLFNINHEKSYKEAKKEFMKNYFLDLLVMKLGNISSVAKTAKLARRHIYRIFKDLEIDHEERRREKLKHEHYLSENINKIMEDTLEQLNVSIKARDLVEIDDNYLSLDDVSSVKLSYDDAMLMFEKEYLSKALAEHGFNIQKTSDAIDLSERTLYRKIQKLDIAVA